jgi:CDGSH-type Zn-finger protein
MNDRRLPQAHHVIEFAGEREPKTVRICRCWKSQRFPYCDDAHKQLLEHGESVGPYIARLDPHFPGRAAQGNQQLVESVVPSGRVFTRGSLLTTGLVCVVTSGLILRAWLNRPELNINRVSSSI